MTSLIAAGGSGRSTSVIPAVPAARSVTTTAFILDPSLCGTVALSDRAILTPEIVLLAGSDEALKPLRADHEPCYVTSSPATTPGNDIPAAFAPLTASGRTVCSKISN